MSKIYFIAILIITNLFISSEAFASNEFGVLSSNPDNLTYDLKDFPMLSDLTFTSDIENYSLEISLYKAINRPIYDTVSDIITYKENKYKYLYELKKMVTNSSYLTNFVIPELAEGKYLISWRVNQCTQDCLVLSNDFNTRREAAKAYAKKGIQPFEVKTNFKDTIYSKKHLIYLIVPSIILLFWVIRKKITPSKRRGYL